MATQPVKFTDARLKAAPATTFVETVNRPFVESEFRRFEEYTTVDEAHTVMLAEQGIISGEDAAAILRTLAEWRETARAGIELRPELSSYLFQIEAFLAERLGPDIAGRMHTARGRADYGSTSLSLLHRNRLVALLHDVIAFQATILEEAGRYVDAIMPGYTHLQQSQPQTFGHYLLSHFFPFARDFDRITECIGRLNLSSLGCLARAGTGWPINRSRTAELLGFDGLVMNTQDQVCYRREHVTEVAGCLSLLMLNLNRIATDLDVWYSEEFGFIDFGDAYAGSSSLLPQKKNPYPFERCRALAGEAMGWFASAAGVARLPHSSAADPTFSPLHDGGLAITQTGYCSDMLRLMNEVLSTIRINRERMRAGLLRSWSTTSNLADEIVRHRNLSFRQAHAIVGRLVRQSLESNLLPGEVRASHVDAAAAEVFGQSVGLSDDQVRDALDPQRFIETRTSEGSASPERMAEALALAGEQLAAQREWLATFTGKLTDAQHRLNHAIAAITEKQ